VVLYFQQLNLYSRNDSPVGNEFLFGLSQSHLLYIVPIILAFIRDILKWAFKKLARTLMKFEDHHRKETMNRSIAYKSFFFNFFNYYFSFYYIAFFKIYFEKCDENDCLNELRLNLYIFYAKDTITEVFSLFVSYFYLIPKTFAEIKPDANKSNKYFYYSREKYSEDLFDDNYLHVILNFGYLIQFGSCSPLLLLMTVIQVFCYRLTNAIKFSQISYCDAVSGSQGTGIFLRLLRILIFLGLIINISTVLFSNSSLTLLTLDQKMVILFLTENFVVFLLFFVKFDTLPEWFSSFKDIIELEYKAKIHKKAVVRAKPILQRKNTF